MAITHSYWVAKSQNFVFLYVGFSGSPWIQNQLSNERGFEGKQEENHNVILSESGTLQGQLILHNQPWGGLYSPTHPAERIAFRKGQMTQVHHGWATLDP